MINAASQSEIPLAPLPTGLVAPPAPGPFEEVLPTSVGSSSSCVPVRGSSSTQSRSLSLSAPVLHKDLLQALQDPRADLAPDEFERLRGQIERAKNEVVVEGQSEQKSGQQVQGM